MTPFIKAAASVAVIGLAVPANARTVTLDVTMKSYWGTPTYMVGYLVDKNGNYVKTVLAEGSSGQYFEHMRRWMRMYMRAGQGFNGVTGASFGPSSSRQISFDLPDSDFNSGMKLQFETAVEHQQDVPDEATIALNSSDNGTAVNGNGYVSTITAHF